MIELVDFNEIYGKGIAETAAPAKKTRRSTSTKKKATAEVATEEAPATEASSEESKSAE
jgi:large subunit ribosomal protein L17